MSPKITVLMAVFNGEKFIKEAVDSILSQSFTDFEFIVINDASTDLTVPIIESYKDPRITLIHNKKNSGLPASLNTGLDLAKGTYIARMDGDDIALPERLRKQFKLMEINENINICGSWIEAFGDENRIITLPEKDEDIRTGLLFVNCLAHPSIMMRKGVLDKNGLRYDSSLTSSIDYDLWARAIDKCMFYNVQEVLLKYRVHSNQISVDKQKEQLFNSMKVKKDLLERIGITPTEEELELHYLIGEGLFKPENVEEIENASKWFNVLERSMNISEKHPCYKEITARHLLTYYNNNADKGLPAAISFLRKFMFRSDVDMINKLRYLQKVFYSSYFKKI
ncbi:MAG TPA: glycosyltransferase [bacterium]|nr:glycosyltransferase [bacterium]